MWVLHPRRTRLHDVATHIRAATGEALALLDADGPTGNADFDAAASALREAGDAAVVIAGERLAERLGGAESAMALAFEAGARFTYVTRRANDRGALRAGVHPRLLPGGRTAEDGLDEVEAVWGPVMNRVPGRDSHAILQACADGKIDVLLLVGVDPLRDATDADLALRALQNVPYKVVQGLELGSLEPFVDAFLPAAPFLEKTGHVTTWEGRGQLMHPVRGTEGISLADWEIFASMALACGGDLGFETLEELHEEMAGLLAPREVTLAVGAPETDRAADGLRLFTYPLLVDEGRLSDRADELKAALAQEPFVEIHPSDADGLGIVAGARGVVRTVAGAAELPARVTEDVARGSVFVPFNQAGFAANALLSGSFTAEVTLEPIASEVAAPVDEEVSA